MLTNGNFSDLGPFYKLPLQLSPPQVSVSVSGDLVLSNSCRAKSSGDGGDS